MLATAKEYDSMYREPLDGFIGIKKTSSGEVEMLTILDMSSVFKNKYDVAIALAKKL